MGSLTNHQKNHHDISIIMVPFPAQGHLNQFLQLSCLVSSHGLPVYYAGSATHNRQARARINGLSPLDVAQIHFLDLPTPSFATPTPNPNSKDKFPVQLHPAWEATLSQRQPFTDFLRNMSSKSKRVIVIHDPMMAYVVQDVSSVPKVESYVFNCIPAFCQALLAWEAKGEPMPEELKGLRPLTGDLPNEVQNFVALQYEHLDPNLRAGDIHNTCRLIEAPYLDLLARWSPGKKNWAIGPILPTKLCSGKNFESRHQCLEWLDKQEAKSVIYVTFGTTTSLSDEQIEEIALGLERSKQKFLWVLREADRGDVFDGEVRVPRLPEGFEERVKEVGIVVREWAPQPEILAHSSTGGFMSHCGWNSCIESITMGVPIAAWPMHSDQPTNTVLVTEILKAGILVREWNKMEETVKASTVENVVKRLIASEGDEIRNRAEKLAGTVRQATEEGGVSRLEFESFIAHISREDDLLPKSNDPAFEIGMLKKITEGQGALLW